MFAGLMSPVDDSRFVPHPHPTGSFAQNAQGQLQRRLANAIQVAGQIFTLQQIHHQEVQPGFEIGTHIAYGDHVGVLRQAGDSARSTLESLPELLACPVIGRGDGDHFYGYECAPAARRWPGIRRRTHPARSPPRSVPPHQSVAASNPSSPDMLRILRKPDARVSRPSGKIRTQPHARWLGAAAQHIATTYAITAMAAAHRAIS